MTLFLDFLNSIELSADLISPSDWLPACLSTLAPIAGSFTTGDYNHDGIINAADFVLWRDTDGSPAGYTTWQSHFGLEAGTGMGDSLQASVPEPTAWVLILCAVAAVARVARRSLA